MISTSPTFAPLNLRQDAPLRPPAWRWLRAQAVNADGGGPRRWIDDNDTCAAMELQKALDRCGHMDSMFNLLHRYPDRVNAWQVFTAQDKDGSATRSALEAHLLCADFNLEDTPASICMERGAVSVYERLFFNVRDRLDNAGWIFNHAIGASVHTGLADNDSGLVWKVLGYCCGLKVLESFMRLLPRQMITDDLLADKMIREYGKVLAFRLALYTALTLRARDPFAKLELLKVSQMYQQLEQQAQGTPGGEDTNLVGLQMALEQVQFTLRDRETPSKVPTVLPNGVELRADQIMRAAAGLPYEVPGSMTQAKFPQSRTVTDGELDKKAPPLLGE
jgi:hypothetical protein